MRKIGEVTRLVRLLLEEVGGNRDEAKALFMRVLHREARIANDVKLSFEAVSSRLNYDPGTGVFTWKTGRSDRIGQVAGSGKKYRYIRLGARSYLAHRLAWLLMMGEWPSIDVDHKNGNALDNSWKNLRQATTSQNMANRSANSNKKSGLPIGVSRKGNRFRASIKVNGKSTHLGSFAELAAAVERRRIAAEALFGEFVRSE